MIRKFVRKKSMKYLLIVILLPLFTLVSCDSDAPPPPTEEMFYPLAVGNSWVYEVTITDSTGNIVEITTDTQLVSKDTLINQERWYFVGNEKFGGVYMTNRDSGLYVLALSFARHTYEPRLFYPYPASIGTSRTYRDTVEGANAVLTDSLFIAATDTTIITTAGSFPSYHYVEKSITEIDFDTTSKLHTDIFISPNIGLVVRSDESTMSDGTRYVTQVMRLQRRSF